MKLLDRYVVRSLNNERALVEDLRRARRVFYGCLVLFFVAFAAIGVRLWWGPGSPADWVGGIVLGALSAWGALTGVVRMHAYRSGWLDGRHQMVRALSEGLDRGMTPEEWLQGEFERDLYVLGACGSRDRGDSSGEGDV